MPKKTIKIKLDPPKHQLAVFDEKLKAIESELKKSNKDFKLPDSVVK